MRLFKTKSFDRFATNEDLANSTLHDAIRRAEAGLIDADLGGGVIKQRLARRLLAERMLAMDDKALLSAVRNGTIMEIDDNG